MCKTDSCFRNKFYTPVILLLLLCISIPMMHSCADKAEIPSFLRIDSIAVDSTSYDSTGSVSSKIKFAWVYVDENLQGVYQLPFRVPIIKDGTANLKIYAGVQENGLSDLALRYPFYQRDEMIVTFTPGDTLTVLPHVRYKKGLKIPYLEDFNVNFAQTIYKDQGGGHFDYLMDQAKAFEGNGCGYFYLGQNEPALICTTKVVYTPKNMSAYMIEFNYRNNCDFLVGLRTSQTGETILGVRARPDWNKFYMNITPAVDALPGTDLQIFFIVPQDTLVPIQEVFIDNLKLIY